MRLKKQFIILAFLVFAGLFGIHFYQSSRPIVEVFAARRGTAVYAVYGTVKVVPTLTFNVHARSGGILKFSDRSRRPPISSASKSPTANCSAKS